MDHTAQLKKNQNFLGSVGYRAILSKYETSFAFAAQHHLFRKENIPCDTIRKVIFLGSITGPPRIENSDIPFFVPNISVDFVSAFNNSHYPVIYGLRKEEYYINIFFSILRRTRSPFLGIENFLLVSETAMNLCILQFLPRRFWFIKNQNKKKPYRVERLFLWHPQFLEYQKYLIL